MKKAKILVLMAIVLSCVMSSCTGGVEDGKPSEYEIYENAAYHDENGKHVEYNEYPHWKKEYAPSDAPGQQTVEFIGQTYGGSFVSLDSFNIMTGIEPILNYKGDGVTFKVYEHSKKLYSIDFVVDKSAISQNSALTSDEIAEMANGIVDRYSDHSKYYRELKVYNVPFSYGETVEMYSWEYYKKVNGERSRYDSITVEIYRDGTVNSVTMNELGCWSEKDTVIHYDSKELLEAVDEKIKQVERFRKYGDFNYFIDYNDHTYYVLEDDSIGLFVSLSLYIYPENHNTERIVENFDFLIKKTAYKFN